MNASGKLLNALAVRDAGQYRKAASLLRPLADAGDIEARAHLAMLMIQGDHRFTTSEELQTWYANATNEELATYQCELKHDIDQALRWLEEASASGIGPATHNLAMAYLGGHGDLPAEDRRRKVKELLARARDQGFAFFGSAEGVEQYLSILEGYADGQGCGMPWEASRDPDFR